MKKLLLAVVFLSTLFADTSNEVTISDLKEAVYKLILKFQELSHCTTVNDNELSKKIKNLKLIINNNQKLNKNEREKLYESIKNLEKKLNEIENRKIILTQEKKDYLDKYIAKFVLENKSVLEKIKGESK
jgi:esterase/lipase